MEPYKQVIAGTMRMTGAQADEIITTLIDNANDSNCAEELGMTVSEWNAYISCFEEQVRHVVRDSLRG